MRLATAAFPLLLLLFSCITPGISDQYRRIYSRIKAKKELGITGRTSSKDTKLLLLLSMSSLGLIAAYLTTVPFTKTGLYAVMMDSPGAELAREQSLKLLDNIVIKYGFSYFISIIAPLTCALIVQSMRWSALSIRQIALIVVMLIIIFCVMLPGERSAAVLSILAAAFSFNMKVGIRKGWRVICIAAACGLSVIIIQTLLREGETLTSFEAVYSAISIVFIRIFTVPYVVGIYMLKYAQDFGLTGISTIRPLAAMSGIGYINLPNAVMLNTMSGITPEGESGFMNASFFFDFQASFGTGVGIMVALICAFSLDAVCVFFRALKGNRLKALYSILLVQMLALLSSSFFSCLNTHGILWTCLIAILMKLIVRKDSSSYVAGQIFLRHSNSRCRANSP